MIYLDSAATTRPSSAVVETVQQSLTGCFANPSSIHRLGFLAEKALREARADASAPFGCDPQHIVFTSGGTESNQLALCGSLAAKKSRGLILIPETEHASVFDAPLPRDRVRPIPVDGEGRLDYDRLRRTLREQEVALIAAMHVNNEIGTIHDVAAIRRLIDEAGSEAHLHVDGVQGYGKIALAEVVGSVDSYAFSGHKLHALKGVGGLYVRDLKRLAPLLTGGGQEMGRRAGTENLTGILSLGTAVRHALRVDADHAKQLRQAFLAAFAESGEAYRLNGAPEACSDYVASLSLEGVPGEALVHTMETKEIYLSTRSACGSKRGGISRVLRAIGRTADEAEGTFRVSFALDAAGELGFEATLAQRIEAVQQAAREIADAVREIRALTGRRQRRGSGGRR